MKWVLTFVLLHFKKGGCKTLRHSRYRGRGGTFVLLPASQLSMISPFYATALLEARCLLPNAEVSDSSNRILGGTSLRNLLKEEDRPRPSVNNYLPQGGTTAGRHGWGQMCEVLSSSWMLFALLGHV